jgi:hypothetical protein
MEKAFLRLEIMERTYEEGTEAVHRYKSLKRECFGEKTPRSLEVAQRLIQ